MSFFEKLKSAYSQGMSDVEVCRELEITLPTFQRMYEEQPAFQKAVDYGRMLSQAWWLEQGRKNLTNKEFATTLWAFNMKNRHGWADKTETKSSGDGDYTNIDDLRAKLVKALPKLIKNFGPELSDAEMLKKLSQYSSHQRDDDEAN